MEKRTAEIYDTRLEIVRRLGIAAEYKDNETGEHILRMSQYCQLTGREYSLSQEEQTLLLNASPMHDVGKIGIPDRILLKPGKLDAEEWEIMKTHTTIGGVIFGDHPSELLRTARMIALTHHERWDGSGSHFDPEVVEAFLSALPDILKIRSEHLDEDLALTHAI